MQFSHPEWFFLLLLVPLLLVTAILASRARGQAWRRLAGERLRTLLVKRGPHTRRWVAFSLGLIAFSLLVAGIAIPHAGYREEAEVVRGRNVLLAIDVSRSMLAKDESPNRLTAARTVALDLLETFSGDRVGLIAFSGGPWLQAPLTIDHRALTETLQQLDAETLPRGGSDLSAAVKLAIETFQKTGQSDNALIILSDGEAHDGDTDHAADLAAEAGVRIFTIGFGSDEGSFLEDPSRPGERLRDRGGNLIFTRLKTDQLRTLASRTGGFYMSGNGKYLTANLQKAVEQMDQFEAEGGQRRIPIHRYQWFLFPAILCLLAALLTNTAWGLLWRSAAVLLVMSLAAPPAEARILPATEAEKALTAGDYSKSRDLFAQEADRSGGERRARLKLGQGAASYRAGSYRGALKAYAEALLSRNPEVQTEASFALGNTIYNLTLQDLGSGDSGPSLEGLDQAITNLGEALEHYDQALTLAGEHEQARQNREHVEKIIEMLKQQQQQQQEQQEQEQSGEENQKENEDQQEDGEDGQEGNEGQNENEGEGSQDNEERPPDNENPSESNEEQEGNGNEEEGEEGNESGTQPPPQAGNDEGESSEEQGEPLNPAEYGDVSPEEQARRILADNADFQTTPIAQRRMKQPRTKKDW